MPRDQQVSSERTVWKRCCASWLTFSVTLQSPSASYSKETKKLAGNFLREIK